MSSPPHYDIAVVGAGPAGARTAEVLAQRGFRVVLLEKDAQAGQPVHCTGIVSAECFRQYDLPESIVIRQINSFILRAPSGRGLALRRDDTQAYVLDRVALDTLLVQRAVDAGAELILNAHVQDIRWTGDGVVLQGAIAHRPQTLSARAAVVATGYGASLARKIGLTMFRDVVSGCQAVVEAENVAEVEVFTGRAFGFGGYGWLVPWRPGQALVGLLTRKHTVRLMNEHIQRLQAQGRIGALKQVFRCRAIPLGVTGRTVMNGILGVGDAVSQVKPTSGGGIYYGMLGADAAADVLSDALERNDTTAAGLAPYEERWRSVMESEVRQGFALRRVLEQLPDSVVEHLHRLLGLPVVKRLFLATASFDFHSGPLSKALSYLQGQADTSSEATA